jgi:hypothetical protein
MPELPLPTPETFRVIRQAYEQSKIHPNCPPYSQQQQQHDKSILDHTAKYGAMVNYEIRKSPIGDGTGCGIFVTEFVAKGRPVWGCELFGIFRKAMEWKSFLELLPDDILGKMSTWSYVMRHVDTGGMHFVVAVDLDASTVMNHGRSTHDDKHNHDSNTTTANVALDYSSDGKSQYYFAARDIQVGEEILCDYSEFHVYDHPLDWYMETYYEVCKARLGER